VRILAVDDATSRGEVRYRALVEDMPAMVCRFLPDGTLTFINSAYCSYFNKRREHLLGQNFFQFIPEDDQEKVRDHFISLTPDNATVTYDHQVMAPDGTIRWQRWTDRALFDEQGRVLEYQSIGNDITEHKEAEQALRESEEKYRTILDSIDEGYFEVDLAGNFTFFNESLCKIAGYSRNELLGMNNRDYATAATAQKMYQIFSRIYRTGEPAKVLDYEIFRKDGNPRILEVSASLMHDLQDKPIGFRGVVRDVTERKRAEEALRESEERFREMAENVREVFWMFDWIEQKMIYVSPAYQEIWSRSIEDLYNCSEEWTDSIYPYDREYARESLARIVETGEGVAREYRIVRPDGTVRWISDRSFPIRERSGDVRRLAGIAEDITERRQAIEALRASEEKYRTVLEANPDPVVVYDINGKVVYFNPAFTRVFGWSLGERLGRKMDIFVPEENWPETQVMTDRVSAGESFSGIESRRYTKEGKVIPVSISGAILRDVHGKPMESFINLRDISEQKSL
jgi:PAS domain S-box-containing protein